MSYKPQLDKVSETDTTPDVLINKLVAGDNITIAQGNVGDNETLTISAVGGVSPTSHYATLPISNPPTDTEVSSVFGNANAVTPGFTGFINNSNSGLDTNVYMVVLNGFSWWVVPLTALIKASSFTSIDQFRGGTFSDELFTVAGGVQEFDLLYDGTNYHFFYTNPYGNGTKYRTASAVPGLAAAAETAVSGVGSYPTAQLIDGQWHLWGWDAGSTKSKHYLSTAPDFGYVYQDDMPTNFADISVRRNPVDGLYYAGYKSIGTYYAGIMQASDPGGPWTDLGYVFEDMGRAGWHFIEEADPMVFFSDSRAFMLFSGWDGHWQRIGLVELNTTTYRALHHPVCIANPTETWQQRNTSPKIFNAVYLESNGLVYYSQNPSAAGITTGWGSITPGSAPGDGRTDLDILRLTLLTDAVWDVATGTPGYIHGSATCSASGIVMTTSTGGCYGDVNIGSIFTADFTLTVVFSIHSMPATYATILGLSPWDRSYDPTIHFYIHSDSKFYVEVHADDHTHIDFFSTDTFTTGIDYTAVLTRRSGVIALTINSVAEGGGMMAGSIDVLNEWYIGNNKGLVDTGLYQFDGTVKSAVMVMT